ncbi:MAG: tyrosine-type recombinase/integrase [Ferruginibacter sp.]
MKKLTCDFLLHRGHENIALHFEIDSKFVSCLRKSVTIRWSSSNKCWYCLCNRQNFESVTKTATGNGYVIDFLKLKASLQLRQSSKLDGPAKSMLPEKVISRKTEVVKAVGLLSEGNAAEIQRFSRQLVLKSYSKSTIRTYTNELSQFLAILKNTPATSLDSNRMKDYLQYCHKTLHLSEATLHSRMNALKFYYEQVLNKEKFFWEIPRPKKPLLLPRIFNQDEVADIINSMDNKKHKVMLMMAYSAGLRVSEVVAIKTYNIDSKRMCILIEQAKGKKDRVVSLSPVLLVMLREYAKLYKPSGKGFLFEGSIKTAPYSTRSLQEVIHKAKKKAGIMKPGSIHSLRHSFATHLLDKGTDISMIQKLLGHNDIKTTLRYLHTTNKDLLKIISPLDNLNLK